MSKLIAQILVALACLASVSLSQAPKGKAFDHIFILWLEDYDDSAAFNQAFKFYISSGLTLLNYHAVTEGSQANHVASIGGDYFGIRPQATNGTIDPNSDIYNIPANYSTIVDLLETKGITWKAYIEDLPSPCYTASYSNNYYRKYNPFVSFQSITSNPARCANVVPSTQLATDLSQGKLPNVMYYIPNYLNNGDGSNFTYSAQWVNTFLPPLLANPNFLNNTLLVLLFDDNDYENTSNNEIKTFVLGDAVPSTLHNTTDNQFYTHYSLLTTIEDNWGLGNLGRNDAKAELSNVFSFVALAEGVVDVNVTNQPDLVDPQDGFLTNTNTNTKVSGASANIASKVVGGLLVGVTALLVML